MQGDAEKMSAVTVHVRKIRDVLDYKAARFRGWDGLDDGCHECGKKFRPPCDVYAAEDPDNMPPAGHLFPQMWWLLFCASCFKKYFEPVAEPRQEALI